MVFELAFCLLSFGLALGEGFVVDAKRSPESKNVVCQKGRDESVLASFEVDPVGRDDLLDDVFVDPLSEKRLALE